MDTPTKAELAVPDCARPDQHPMRIAVGIATLGREHLLASTLKRLACQTRPADCVMLCAPTGTNLDAILRDFPWVSLIHGPQGSSHQRNAIIGALTDYDVVLFLDDDFVLAPDYVARLERLFIAVPDVALVTGNVLRDGILGPGLTFEDADAIVENLPPILEPESDQHEAALKDVFNGYGCNMAARLQSVRRRSVTFDENLPLYAWLEDVDFSRQLASCGRIVKDRRLRGVHLGVKAGRQKGRRLGYSQIANPIYLMRKGTCSVRKGLYLMSRNIAANLMRSPCPEPWVDRVGRLHGNMIAIADMMLGRLRPDRILKLM